MEEYNNCDDKEKYVLYEIEKIGTIGIQNAFAESGLLIERENQLKKNSNDYNSENSSNKNNNEPILLEENNKLELISQTAGILDLNVGDLIQKFSEDKLIKLEDWLRSKNKILLTFFSSEGNLF